MVKREQIKIGSMIRCNRHGWLSVEGFGISPVVVWGSNNKGKKFAVMIDSIEEVLTTYDPNRMRDCAI